MHLIKRLTPWLLATLLAATTVLAGAGEARIAVAADGADANATVSAVAARAPYILIFDTHGTLLESHPNPVAANPGSAGPALATWLGEKKIDMLIAGDFGAKLSPALAEQNINTVVARGPANEAVKEVGQ
ncbi:NifB/NifX family molybdenum-iron cluster-binding protein [Thiohalophilus sp.]|uniref:NifB/NifX family molybdenum-iron cluster-binding protein n=1 Tax=Thiohalophilus sp. TaxID=3028392 RepID=UPI002ACEDD11|nr:NifB/NifX family molybdenum-iron cluster-binding protein [Thiohalophilus sp.]MDZ7802730.1 NifB/NifX family molybdenum-iron cluster-binding protein [Thiohalophilus sp.]